MWQPNRQWWSSNNIAMSLNVDVSREENKNQNTVSIPFQRKTIQFSGSFAIYLRQMDVFIKLVKQRL